MNSILTNPNTAGNFTAVSKSINTINDDITEINSIINSIGNALDINIPLIGGIPVIALTITLHPVVNLYTITKTANTYIDITPQGIINMFTNFTITTGGTGVPANTPIVIATIGTPIKYQGLYHYSVYDASLTFTFMEFQSTGPYICTLSTSNILFLAANTSYNFASKFSTIYPSSPNFMLPLSVDSIEEINDE